MPVTYSRILLKISGEALGGKEGVGLNANMLLHVAREIRDIHAKNIQVVIVIGAGNIFRGIEESKTLHINRIKSDFIGMESTVVNVLILSEVLSSLGVKNRAFSALGQNKVIDMYTIRRALSMVKKGYVVLCAGGTGRPRVSTDSAATLRAHELGCDIILKATKVGGVYNDDPLKNKRAKKYEKISFDEALKKRLKIMDREAFLMAKKHNIPIRVFNIFQKNVISRLVTNKKIGSLIY